MATVSGSASTTTRNPRHWQLAVLVMATLPEIPTSLGHRARLFDHLVGEREQHRRNRQAERLGDLQIDDEIEFNRLLDRQIGRLRSAQNPVNITSGAPELVSKVYSIGHQTSRFNIVTRAVHGRQSSVECQRINANAVGVYKRIGRDIKRVRATCDRIKHRRNIFSTPDFKDGGIEAENARCLVNSSHVQHVSGIAGIAHNCQSAQTGHSLAQNFETFGSKICGLARQAGEVAARSPQTRYEAGGNRVARQREDDWDDRGRLLCREDRLGPIRHNHIDLEPDELGCDLGGAFIATLRPAILDRDILPLAPAQLTQPLHKGAGPLALCCSRARAKEPDGRQLRLLRPRHHRPCCRAAEQSDEFTASHSITSWAMASSLSGIWRPSALAVFRLMASSN